MRQFDPAQIRVFLSDIDGTAVRPDKQIAKATHEAIDLLAARGVAFTLVSARPPRGMRHVVEAFGLKHPYAGFNGGSLVDASGSVLSRSFLSAEAALESIALGRAAGYEVYVFADEEWLLTDVNLPYVAVEQHTLQFPPCQVPDFMPWITRIEKIVIATDDAAGLIALETLAAAQLAGRAHASRSQTYYLDITAAQADKGNAVRLLARHFNIGEHQIAVAGDGANDIPMFGVAGFSIAMGQGAPAVHAAADHVAGSNAEDGLAAAIRLLWK